MSDVALGDPPLNSDETARPQNDPAVDLHFPIESWTITITDIAVKNVAVDLQRVITAMRCQRIPIGMYIAIELNELRHKTAIKSIPYAGDILWDDKIILPLSICTHICFKIYASFELECILGMGELLYTFRTTVQEVLDRKKGPVPFPLPFQFGAGDLSFSLTFDMSHCREGDSPFSSPSSTGDPFDPSDNMDTFNQVTDRGYAALLRYRHHRQEQELMKAIEHFSLASGFCHFLHPCHSTAVFNLAAAAFVRYHMDGNYAGLDNAIMLYLVALRSRPLGNRDRENTLLHLALALLSSSKHLVPDAKRVIHHMDIVLELPLGDSFLRRAAMFAIQAYTPLATAPGSTRDQNQSISWSSDRFRQTLDFLTTEDCSEEYIARCREKLRGPEQPCHFLQKRKLALALQSRYSRDGTGQALDEAILHLQDCTVLLPTNPCLLNDLAMSFVSRFDRLGADADLNDAILCYQKALELQTGHGLYTLNLISALDKRFQRRRDLKDLDGAIKHGSEVLFSTPLGWYDLPAVIGHARKLVARWRYRGNRIDLESATEVLQSALEHLPDGHSRRPLALGLLSEAQLKRFGYSGDQQNLSDAILHSRAAVVLCPVGHENRPVALYSLAGALMALFRHRGDPKDIGEAITTYQAALTLESDSVFFLHDLSIAQMLRFECQGNKQDIDDAILQLRKGLSKATGDLVLAPLTGALAAALYTRFSYCDNDLRTLDEAIQYFRQGLALPGVPHLTRASMFADYATALHAYDRSLPQPDKPTAEQVIELYRESLALHGVDDESRALALTNLGVALVKLGSKEAVDEAILAHKEALKLHTAPRLPHALMVLGDAYFHRYRRSQDKRDLYDADQYARRALESFRTDDARRSHCFLLVAEIACSALDHQFYQRASDDHDPFPTQYFKSATESRFTNPLSCLRACGQWVNYAESYGHDSALQAYGRSLQILDDILSSNALISSRLEMMKVIPPSLAVDAASSALRHGNTILAIELLERGRALVWAQMARCRTPIEQLLQCDERSKGLASKFQNLSSLLNNAHTMEGLGASTEETIRRYEKTFSEWNTVIEDIRKLDGFDRFLCPPLFSDLREAACEGPVIILVSSVGSCDAIIVLHRQSPLHIPLATNSQELWELVMDVQTIVRNSRDDSRTGVRLRETLQKLWDIVVSPVVAELVNVIKKRSRIWWCPTSGLTLLPLHAAGEYFREGGKYLSQFYVSSYTPSLSALIKARTNLHETTTKTKHLAAIGQSQPVGHTMPLLSVERELDILESLVPEGTVKLSKIPSGISTKGAALCALQKNTWVHFSCHGVQQLKEPYKSCFMMLDEPLTLLDIMRTDLTSHEFAFLSACETAVGHVNAPDEVIHLAAGLQFGGVKSVIGSMWEVEDATVGHLVKEFYSEMFAGGKADCTKAARALHKALRSEAAKRMSLAQRIVFIHIGV